jgi:hypothetical protein
MWVSDDELDCTPRKPRISFRGIASEILPNHLYLGDFTSANSPERVYSHVISLGTENEHLAYDPKHPNHTRIELDDVDDAPIGKHFEQCFDIIDSGGCVLIHCWAGISRSATIVLAYLMRRKGMALDVAWCFVKERRSCINPNDGFILELEKIMRVSQLTFESKLLAAGIDCDDAKSYSDVPTICAQIFHDFRSKTFRFKVALFGPRFPALVPNPVTHEEKRWNHMEERLSTAHFALQIENSTLHFLSDSLVTITKGHTRSDCLVLMAVDPRELGTVDNNFMTRNAIGSVIADWNCNRTFERGECDSYRFIKAACSSFGSFESFEMLRRYFNYVSSLPTGTQDIPRCLLDSKGAIIKYNGDKCFWTSHGAMDKIINQKQYIYLLERSHPGSGRVLKLFCQGWNCACQWGDNCAFKNFTLTSTNAKETVSLWDWMRTHGASKPFTTQDEQALSRPKEDDLKVLVLEDVGDRAVELVTLLNCFEQITGRRLICHFDLIVATGSGALVARLLVYMRMSAYGILGAFAQNGTLDGLLSDMPASARQFPKLAIAEQPITENFIISQNTWGSRRIGAVVRVGLNRDCYYCTLPLYNLALPSHANDSDQKATFNAILSIL